MPGIGESEAADRDYLSLYREKLADSDVVLWAIHADTRSTLFDAQALDFMLSGASPQEQGDLIAKVSFVLTKADLLTPPPWIYLRDGEGGQFIPSKAIRERLEKKARYYQEILVRPYGGLNSSRTYMSDGFDIADLDFQYDANHITYSGFISDEVLARYSSTYPRFAEVFERLAANHCVIPVSALFRYNLISLMVVIVNKLGVSAIGRFQRLVDGSPDYRRRAAAHYADLWEYNGLG